MLWGRSFLQVGPQGHRDLLCVGSWLCSCWRQEQESILQPLTTLALLARHLVVVSWARVCSSMSPMPPALSHCGLWAALLVGIACSIFSSFLSAVAQICQPQMLPLPRGLPLRFLSC